LIRKARIGLLDGDENGYRPLKAKTCSRLFKMARGLVPMMLNVNGATKVSAGGA
jgi:hypothetical protein